MTTNYQAGSTQGDLIRREIFRIIADGINDKATIYTYIENELNIPRPTVRRVTCELVRDLEQIVRILKGQKLIKNYKQTGVE